MVEFIDSHYNYKVLSEVIKMKLYRKKLLVLHVHSTEKMFLTFPAHFKLGYQVTNFFL